jgi:hypothetical protein
MSKLTNINKIIYKLNYLVDGNINTIFVFYGKKISSELQKYCDRKKII